MEQFRRLFSPFKIGPAVVHNRIVFGANEHRLQVPTEPPNERVVHYYEARAKGGAGLIITSYLVPTPYTTAGMPTAAQDDKAIPAFASVVRAIHEHGAKAFAQFNHVGRLVRVRTFGGSTLGPSPIRTPGPFQGRYQIPHEMDTNEIKRVVKDYGNGAYRMREAGYDGVEIGMMRGLLIATFMSPAFNCRTDEYGGCLDNRLRFPLEIIDAVRAAVGPDFVVGVRIDGDEFTDGGLTLDDAKVIAPKLEATGKLDYLNVAAGLTDAAHVPCMYLPLAPFAHLAAGIKEVVALPVIFGGRVNDPILAEQILADNHADLISMARPLVADPELPNKAREGRIDEIRKCIACNDSCKGILFERAPLTCAINPEAGREAEFAIKPVTNKKRIMIIGGGAAGLETARVAALRGHEVTLYEKEAELGGQLNIAAKAPGRVDFAEVPRYYTLQMNLLNVEVHLGTEVTAEIVKEKNPDAIVVATGSLPEKPLLPRSDMENVVEIREVLQGKVKVGNNVVVVDEEYHSHGLTVADFLSDRGAKVELITEAFFAGMELDDATISIVYGRLLTKGVTITPLTKLKEIKGNTVTVFNVFTKEERQIGGVDTVVIASRGRADDTLYRSLKGKVNELYAVGQCESPRVLLHSIWDGARVGRLL